MVQLTGKNFDAEVLQNQPLPVLLLWGAWMDVNTTKIRLQMMKLDETKVKLAQAYIDDVPDLAMKFSIRNCPYVILIVDGMVVAEGTNLTSEILQKIQ
jgi:thioredoxin-like negative regulator of GroEL